MENLQKPWLKFYDHRVDEHVSVKHESLYDFLEDSVSRFGDKPALTFYGRSWSYNETKMIVDRLASALHKDGFKKGDRAALMLPNCPQYIFTLFAIFRLGGIAVQVNPMYVEREISFVLEDSDATHMFVLDALYPKVKKVQGDSALRKVIAIGLGGERIALGEGTCILKKCFRCRLMLLKPPSIRWRMWRSCSIPAARPASLKALC
ncbi:AMP-binding protein [Mesobacillus campisalis]|uniref:AMP-binding protein n=1 Tax=Mesobacillus campisalis TaxID=1408103 RepID=UPI000A7C25B5|nr:AMP-binding protein [Mesobacillus campisalis]